jgi:hypothetical protein
MARQEVFRFLEVSSHSDELRERLANVKDAFEFMMVVNRLGYDFTADEFVEVIEELSSRSHTRRRTGIWPWLRSLPNPLDLRVAPRRKQAPEPSSQASGLNILPLEPSPTETAHLN